jgi:hypothetical protein
MKLSRTYNEKDYKRVITVLGLHHEEWQKEIKHKKQLNKTPCKKEKAKGKELSKPKSSNQKRNQKKFYDKK